MLTWAQNDELWQLIGAYTDAVINRIVGMDHRSEALAARMNVELEAVRRLPRWIDLHTEDDR